MASWHPATEQLALKMGRISVLNETVVEQPEHEAPLVLSFVQEEIETIRNTHAKIAHHVFILLNHSINFFLPKINN